MTERYYTVSEKGRRENRTFYTLLLVTTVTCLILVLSACAVLTYYRIQHGPLPMGDVFTPSCPSNQVWSDCGYACNLTCTHQITFCAAVCREGCECPDQAPLWHHDRCVAKHQCPAYTDNGTLSEPSNPAVVGSDTLHLKPGMGESDKLSRFIQRLWTDRTSAFNSFNLQYDLQHRTEATMAVDRAPDKLFGDVQPEALRVSDIYSSFIDLLDHFNHKVKEKEITTPEKEQAITSFLDAVLSGSIMAQTEQFLKAEGGLFGEQSLRDLLYSIWFEEYPRSSKHNITDSSGFEHVFVGEVKGRKILGLHNWIQFCLLEQAQELNYYGYINDTYLSTNHKLIGVTAQFVWGGQRKRQGSLLLGTSPDFELAVYTVCFLLHPDRTCRFELEGTRLSVQTHDVPHVNDWQISTAYPVI